MFRTIRCARIDGTRGAPARVGDRLRLGAKGRLGRGRRFGPGVKSERARSIAALAVALIGLMLAVPAIGWGLHLMAR
jgi:hypothetical protein